MAKGRLHFDGDNVGIEKEARIYSLTDDVERKINSIPNVIDNTSSTSATDALSANMGRDLQEQINNLASRGRYLSTWNAEIGLPDTNPQVSPYVYRAGDYYIVSNVVSGINYRPHGSSYVIGEASTDVETESVSVNDLYIYDGAQWIRQGSGSGATTTWGSIVGILSNQTDLRNALDDKQDELTVGEGISIDANNVISNTLPGAIVDATAPSNPSQGDLWYDTTNNKLKTYDGTQWNETGVSYVAGDNIQINGTTISATDTKYSAGRNISIDGTTVNARDTVYTAGSNVTIICPVKVDNQGPCPDGFHVPTSTERGDTMRILNNVFGFAANHSTPETYLKMPDAGCRYFTTGVVQDHGGYYWSSTPVGPEDAGFFYYYGPAFYYPENSTKRSQGCSIRPFKDNAVTPDSSWTAIYDGSSIVAGAGIFHNATEGLISISGDGINWTTIADKNLGATTIWNNGDAKTQANCGNHYQRGNNYGFPFSGTVDTKTTKPDASGHGPGNYYYSSTYTIVPNSPWDWSSAQNDNLWGGANPGTFQDCEHPIISAAGGATYTAGDHIEISNANVISTTGLQEELTAGNNITIEDVCHPDNQGPCPDGYHVPSKEDFQSMCTIMSTVGLDTSQVNCETYLKLPYAGMRNDENANQGVGVAAFYHSSTPNTQYSDQCRGLYGRGGAVSVTDLSCRKDGSSVRPFKDTPVVPDGTWTTLYQGTGSAGIFYNSTLGLISLSGDGTNRLTIADKNLGATQVFNYGDTYSEANCGKFYQWGNNYGFARTGSIAEREYLPVNATGYGPGNYYSSNVFRVMSIGEDWINPSDDNLWGGVSQGTRCQNVISAEGTTYTAGNGINIDQNDEISVDTSVVATQTDIANFFDKTSDDADDIDDTNSTNKFVTATDKSTWDGKQDELIAGTNIQIAADGKTISATDTTYTAGNGIDITGTTISADTDVLQEKLTAGDNVTIENVCHKDTQGPCSDGFHIATRSEWDVLRGIVNTFGLTNDHTTYETYFKIPQAPILFAGTGGPYPRGDTATYRVAEEQSYASAYTLAFDNSQVWNRNSSSNKGYGLSLRPFKDVSVMPDSSWTTLYDGSSVATGAGIFHNATEGLISMSGDGTNWTTISDKNLGATTVYNYGDTKSEANCGLVYQWGNNYGFHSTGATTVSTTKVDASNYGPGNYYSSSTFISGDDYYWDTSYNSNLWGGVSQGTRCQNVISAESTTYTAGTGLTLNGTTFSADTTVLATKQDIADLGSFEVVASLPSVSTADTKTIYLLGPIGTGADKYEEWIVTEDAQQQKQRTKIGETSIDLSDLNTKTFYLANTSDLTTAQAAYDWYLSGKNPIIVFEGRAYILSGLALYSPNYALHFIGGASISTTDAGNNKTTPYHLSGRMLNIEYNSSDEVVTIHTYSAGNDFLPSNSTAEVVYTPTENWDPATKKYVDDTVAGAGYTAGDGISIDVNNEISNTLPGAIVSATAPSNPTEGMVWYDTTNDALKAYNGTSWETEGTKMVVLEYGVSTWQDFLDAYNKNAVVYCKVSSGGSGYRMAFMAYTAGSSTPTEVEFQYYRSRSSHSTAANQLDEVYVYKLTSAGVWTTTQRDTAAKAIAGTGIGLSFSSSGMTISADTTVLATKSDLNNISEVPSGGTEGQVLTKGASGYDWEDASGTDYEAGDGITIGRLVKPTSIGTDYHIPSYTEWDNLITAGTTLGAWTENDGVGFSTYLKIPTANSRSTSGAVIGSGDTGSYRTTTSNSQYRYILSISHRQADAGVRLALTYPGYAESVRCFKNTPEVPDSGWTTLYDGSSVATDAGIFYDATNGLISISADGTTWYTIMDKNVGATTVYNYGDTLSQANCGKFYQRGNYYGFPWSGTLSDTSSTQVDTTGYSADGELYYDDTFITGNDDRSSPSNTGLRSATGPGFMEATIKENAISAIGYKAGRGIAIGDIAFKNRGPCAVGYHMGTKNEFYDIYSMGINMGAWTSSSGTNVSAYLLMPYAGVRSNTSGARQTSGGNYWTCSGYMSGTTSSSQLTGGSRGFNDSNNTGPSLTSGLPSQYGFPIRPLKDDYVAPDGSWTTMFNGSSYATGAGIFWNQTLGIISITDGTNGYTLADRNLGATAVRHYGDETTDDNCGNLFQWGNNYAFPRSGSVTTSSAVVNVEGYGPDNPYSNSTFRLYSSIMGGRGRGYGEGADNLWGGEEAGPSVVPGDGNYIGNTLPFDPTNAGSTGQLLTKSGSGYEWQTKYTLPTTTATSGYVLTKTASSASSYAWRAAPATGIQKASASPLDIKYIWAGTQAEYDALDSYSADTLYFTV